MNDLVKRLRSSAQFYHADCELKMACADRIEELEAKLAKAREEGFWAGRSCGGAKKEIDAALAELKGETE